MRVLLHVPMKHVLHMLDHATANTWHHDHRRADADADMHDAAGAYGYYKAKDRRPKPPRAPNGACDPAASSSAQAHGAADAAGLHDRKSFFITQRGGKEAPAGDDDVAVEGSVGLVSVSSDATRMTRCVWLMDTEQCTMLPSKRQKSQCRSALLLLAVTLAQSSHELLFGVLLFQKHGQGKCSMCRAHWRPSQRKNHTLLLSIGAASNTRATGYHQTAMSTRAAALGAVGALGWVQQGRPSPHLWALSGLSGRQKSRTSKH